MAEHKTLVEAILRGEAHCEDFDGWVSHWHSLPNDDPYAHVPLHEYLGLSRDEYTTVALDPIKLRIVIHSREADNERIGEADGSQ